MSSSSDSETELHTRIHQQKVISSLGRRALETDDIDRLMHDAAATVAETLGCDYCKVLELLPSGNVFLRQGVGWQEGIVGEAEVPTDTNSQAGYTLLSEEPVVVDDLRTEERFSGPDLLTDHNVVSGISVIIGTVDDPWGILGVHTTDKIAFTDHDVDFVQSVANLLAAAIERHTYQDELEETVAELQELNTRLEKFASMLAHELRNPVTIGQIYAQHLPEEAAPKAVENVVESFDRIENMIDVMLVLTRRGDAVGERAPVSLAEMARDVWEDVETREASLTVDVDLVIEADEVYVRHLFRNLFENAIRHGGSDVVIEVGTVAGGFYVADDGNGIPPEDRKLVFEPGFTTTADTDGTGLGLAFVDRLAGIYDWDLQLTESDAGGAQFEFRNVAVSDQSD
ncbi:GAF domain-containing protein [Saliphagus sp. GCM10025317]